MEFGYFTLSDNHYENNPRDANQFVSDITAEALYADQLGMHSAWIGEHHFNSLGVLSCPDLVLSYIAARTKHIRLAPAVTVTPLHHPIRVAEQWATLDLLSGGRVDFAAGRGYDSREYAPFHIDFKDNQSIFEEGMEVIQKLWAADGRISHHGKHYWFDDVRITPKPIQNPLPAYIGSFSKPSIELAARLGYGLIVAPFAAAISYGGLEAGRRPLQRDLHQARQQARPADVQLLHALLRQQGAGGRRPRPPNPLLQGMRDPGAAGRSQDRAAELHLFRRHGGAPAQGAARAADRELGAARQLAVHHRHAEEGRGRRLLRGHPLLQRRHEAAPMVKDEMDRFMREVAPNFSGKHNERRKAA